MEKTKWYKIDKGLSVRYVIDSHSKYKHFRVDSPISDEQLHMLDEGHDFAYSSDGTVIVKDTRISKYEEIIVPPGLYNYVQNSDGMEYLEPRLLPEDTDPVVLSGHIRTAASKDIKDWMGSAGLYEEMGLKYKLGLLFYGPPGNGKSTLILQILSGQEFESCVKIIFSGKLPDNRFLKGLSDIPHTKVFIFEELTHAIEHQMAPMLNFLDGVDSVSDSITIATTNYPEKLPGNIVDRPSRFDKLYRFEDPTPEEQIQLLTRFLGRTPNESEIKAVAMDMSIAYLKEACVLHRLKGMSIEDAAKELQGRKAIVRKSFDMRKRMGFE